MKNNFDKARRRIELYMQADILNSTHPLISIRKTCHLSFYFTWKIIKCARTYTLQP